MTLDIARFGKYTVRPVRLHPRANAGDRYDIEGCSRDEAEYFAVYRDQPPPLDPVMWVADFDTEEDAITFASLTEKLLAIREGTKATADSLEKILAGATAMKKERDALVEMLPHLCDDCRLGIPTVIRQKLNGKEVK